MWQCGEWGNLHPESVHIVQYEEQRLETLVLLNLINRNPQVSCQNSAQLLGSLAKWTYWESDQTTHSSLFTFHFVLIWKYAFAKYCFLPCKNYSANEWFPKALRIFVPYRWWLLSCGRIYVIGFCSGAAVSSCCAVKSSYCTPNKCGDPISMGQCAGSYGTLLYQDHW